MKNSKNKANQTQISVSTFNSRTLSNEAFLSELEIALEKINFDVIGLAETKRTVKESSTARTFDSFTMEKQQRIIQTKNAHRSVLLYIQNGFLKLNRSPMFQLE